MPKQNRSIRLYWPHPTADKLKALLNQWGFILRRGGENRSSVKYRDYEIPDGWTVLPSQTMVETFLLRDPENHTRLITSHQNRHENVILTSRFNLRVNTNSTTAKTVLDDTRTGQHYTLHKGSITECHAYGHNIVTPLMIAFIKTAGIEYESRFTEEEARIALAYLWDADFDIKDVLATSQIPNLPERDIAV